MTLLACSFAWLVGLLPICEPATVTAPPDPHAEQDLLADAARGNAPDPPYDHASPPPPEPWLSLAECESGDWLDGGAAFVEGSARWDWAKPGTEIPPWGTSVHHGGLQFHPDTWSWIAPDVLDDPPEFAYDATPAEQIAVGVETQRRQGWEAWPVCSRLVGLR